METIQLTCVHCGKRMAIAAADLGSQVHCPHCQQVVQAPPPAPAPAAEASPPLPPDPVFSAPQERESIFSGGEEAEDDLFGGPPKPRLELPPEPAPPPAPDAGGGRTPWEPRPATGNAPDEAMTVAEPGTRQPPPGGETTVVEGPPPPAEGPPVAPARRAHQSQLGCMALIFLVPYAIIMTAAFGYMLYLYRAYRAIDPLEQMADPDAKNGAKKIQYRVPPDRPLPEKLQTGLGLPLRVGELEVVPLKVELNEGDLVLSLRFRNVSADEAFNPFPASFARPPGRRKGYTYLQAGPRVIEGGDVQWFRDGRMLSERDVDLRPGQALTATLSTSNSTGTREIVKRVLGTPGTFLWRLHVRRGLVEVHGHDVSATAVVGVRFTARDVGHPREAAAARLFQKQWRSGEVGLYAGGGAL